LFFSLLSHSNSPKKLWEQNKNALLVPQTAEPDSTAIRLACAKLAIAAHGAPVHAGEGLALMTEDTRLETVPIPPAENRAAKVPQRVTALK